MIKPQARTRTSQLIRKGIIVKQKQCSDCKAVTTLEAHHNDYENPLDVVFLCKGCHAKRHPRANIALSHLPHEYKRSFESLFLTIDAALAKAGEVER